MSDFITQGTWIRGCPIEPGKYWVTAEDQGGHPGTYKMVIYMGPQPGPQPKTMAELREANKNLRKMAVVNDGTPVPFGEIRRVSAWMPYTEPTPFNGKTTPVDPWETDDEAQTLWGEAPLYHVGNLSLLAWSTLPVVIFSSERGAYYRGVHMFDGYVCTFGQAPLKWEDTFLDDELFIDFSDPEIAAFIRAEIANFFDMDYTKGVQLVRWCGPEDPGPTVYMLRGDTDIPFSSDPAFYGDSAGVHVPELANLPGENTDAWALLRIWQNVYSDRTIRELEEVGSLSRLLQEKEAEENRKALEDEQEARTMGEVTQAMKDLIPEGSTMVRCDHCKMVGIGVPGEVHPQDDLSPFCKGRWVDASAAFSIPIDPEPNLLKSWGDLSRMSTTFHHQADMAWRLSPKVIPTLEDVEVMNVIQDSMVIHVKDREPKSQEGLYWSLPEHLVPSQSLVEGKPAESPPRRSGYDLEDFKKVCPTPEGHDEVETDPPRLVCRNCGFDEADELALEGDGDTLNGASCRFCKVGVMRPVGVGHKCPDRTSCTNPFGCRSKGSCWKVSHTNLNWPKYTIAAHPNRWDDKEDE